MSGVARSGPGRPNDDIQARALSERTLVDWEARYRERFGGDWLRCRLMDISAYGAGLLLIDDTAGPLSAVVLELRAPGGPNAVRLPGEVRHSSVIDGRRRIGIQFVDVGPSEERAVRQIVARRLGFEEPPHAGGRGAA